MTVIFNRLPHFYRIQSTTESLNNCSSWKGACAVWHAEVRRETTPDQRTKHNSASFPSVICRHATLCFLVNPLWDRRNSALASDVADIWPNSLFDKYKGFKDLFHPFNVHIRGDNEAPQTLQVWIYVQFNVRLHTRGLNRSVDQLCGRLQIWSCSWDEHRWGPVNIIWQRKRWPTALHTSTIFKGLAEESVLVYVGFGLISGDWSCSEKHFCGWPLHYLWFSCNGQRLLTGDINPVSIISHLITTGHTEIIEKEQVTSFCVFWIRELVLCLLLHPHHILLV